jgi:AcrR family transcriptional regulator
MPRPRSDIEPRIVHAARRRFLAEGVDGASLRNIARDAETSIGMIYYYFPTKDDLFLGVVEDVYGALMAELEQALAPEAPAIERIRRMSVRLSQLSDTEVEVVRLIVREALVSSSRLERLVERFQRGHLALVLGALGDGLARGEVDPRFHPVILMMATFAVCGAPHLIRRIVGDRGPFASVPAGEPLAHQLADILFSGIGKKPEGAQS